MGFMKNDDGSVNLNSISAIFSGIGVLMSIFGSAQKDRQLEAKYEQKYEEEKSWRNNDHEQHQKWMHDDHVSNQQNMRQDYEKRFGAPLERRKS